MYTTINPVNMIQRLFFFKEEIKSSLKCTANNSGSKTNPILFWFAAHNHSLFFSTTPISCTHKFDLFISIISTVQTKDFHSHSQYMYRQNISIAILSICTAVGMFTRTQTLAAKCQETDAVVWPSGASPAMRDQSLLREIPLWAARNPVNPG